MIKRHLAVLLAAGSLAALPATAPAYAPSPPRAVSAKTCSSGFTHAVIGGRQKCLRRGEFCAHRYRRQYRRYGYRCVKQDYRGNYHLT